MSEVQKCLSTFAVAAVVNDARSAAMADAAIDAYLEPHIQAGTARPALETLLRALGNMRNDTAVASAIRVDLEGRLVRVLDPTDA